MGELDAVTVEKVSQAGELLIRAAAVIGSLSHEQQEHLRKVTGGDLPDSLRYGIRGAKRVSGQVRDSLQTHPPVGLIPLANIARG